jgi:lysophospholipase L1-like esterase
MSSLCVIRRLALSFVGFATFFLGACAAPAAPAKGPAVDERPVEDAAKAGLQTKSNPDLPTLWIIGDSTVKVGTPGQRGWGDEIAPFFDTKKINVVNRAIGGRSSRTFITEGRWAGIVGELHAGDFLLMQFGHNDASPINEDPPVTKSTRARGTIKGNGDESVFVEKNILTGKPETVHSYGWYMRQYITDAKAKGVASIVCSPIPRKSWSPEGKVNRASGNYGLWAKQAADQEHALFIDLNEIIARGYEKLGTAAVEPLFADKGTHTSVAGAQFNARAVVSGIQGLGDKNPLAPFLSTEGKTVPAFQP